MLNLLYKTDLGISVAEGLARIDAYRTMRDLLVLSIEENARFPKATAARRFAESFDWPTVEVRHLMWSVIADECHGTDLLV